MNNAVVHVEMMPVFSIPIRVYYEDTDAGGVVYYANYLKFMERARTEWLRALGFEQDELARREGVLFAVRSVTLDFLKPARFNDLLHATVAVSHRGHASLIFTQAIHNESIRSGGDEAVTLCRGEIRVACLDAVSLAPRSLPEALSTTLPGRTS
jgi:acyl-CoA thioester hydrolase